MATVRLPLKRFPLVHTCSIDELERIQSTINSPVKAETLQRGAAFEWQANRVVVGGLSILASQYGAAMRGYAPNVTIYSMIIALRGAGLSIQSGRPALTVPGKSIVVASPLEPGKFQLAAGYRGIQVAIPPERVRAALGALTGFEQPALPRFEPEQDIAADAGTLRLLRFIVEEAEREASVWRSPLVAGQLAEALIHGLVWSLRHDHSHLLSRPVRPAEPRYLHRVAEYLEANAANPVSVGDLAAIAGVSARAIHAGFRAYRGCSPMAFLRDRRFELARLRLSSSTAVTVAKVALDCGFHHLGRFSVGYRTRFGETPTATRRRARGEDARSAIRPRD